MEWINCSQRIPENGVFVLIFNGSLNIGYLDEESGAFWTSDDFKRLDGVTHWMDLPELPKQ